MYNCGMPTLTVSEQPDMTFDISVESGVYHSGVTRQRLERQLAHYHIVRDRYDAVMRQLAREGKAAVEIPLGKFEQV